MKKEQLLIIGFALVIVAIIVKQKDAIAKLLGIDLAFGKGLNFPNKNKPNQSAPVGSTTGLDYDKQLKSGIGSKSNPSPEVMELQKMLNENGASLVADGVFGQNTFAALSKASKGQYTDITLRQAQSLFLKAIK
jgi:hypothetical protein